MSSGKVIEDVILRFIAMIALITIAIGASIATLIYWLVTNL